MTTQKKESAFERRMKEFHKARERNAASRQRAKGGDDDRSVHEAPALADQGE
jgi:hypothetical protein